MNFWKLLVELHHKAEHFLSILFNQDFSALNKKILGVSILDLLGLILAMMILKEILLFFAKMVGKLLDALFGTISHNILSFAATYLLLTGRSILLRAKATAVYLATRPIIVEKKDLLTQQVLQVYYRLKERYF